MPPAASCPKPLADFDEVIRLKPDFAPVWYNRGELRGQQSDFKAAIEDYRQALNLRPNDAAALAGRGYAYYQLGKYDSGHRRFQPLIGTRSQAARHAGLSGRGPLRDRTLRASRRRLPRGHSSSMPSSPAAYQASAWLMATCPDERFRDSKLAVKAARKAIELRGQKHYRDLEALAAALASDGQFQLATETQRQAIAALPPQMADLSAEFKDRLKRYRAQSAVSRNAGGPAEHAAANDDALNCSKI